jgi:hypothetical protein
MVFAVVDCVPSSCRLTLLLILNNVPRLLLMDVRLCVECREVCAKYALVFEVVMNCFLGSGPSTARQNPHT